MELVNGSPFKYYFMKYKEELIKSMEWLAKKNNTLFIGQSVSYSGNAIFNTLSSIPNSKKLEMPVCEEMQMGMSIGLSLEGFTPISCFPRFDFLLLAVNQLVNHLDKFSVMTNYKYNPNVIIRTAIGSKKPLNGGVQHTQNYTKIFEKFLTNINVVLLNETSEIFPSFKKAYNSLDKRSSLIIEWGDYYNIK